MSAAGCLLRGWVDETERRRWLGHARLLVFPSLAEGFGYPVLEAMSAGVPVLAHRLAAVNEVLGDAGRYVADYPGAWGAAIAGCWNDRDWHARAATAGRVRAAGFVSAFA